MALPSLASPLAALTVDSVLSPYVYVFYAAFLLAFVFTPIMRSVAIYYGIVDKPDLVRKLHAAPVAYLGGVAVFIGWLAGVAITQFQVMHVTEPGLADRLRVPLAVVTSAFIKLKITGQLLAGVTLLSAGIGTKITGFFLHNIAARIEARLDTVVPEEVMFWSILVTSVALTLAMIVFCCNATNLMDGLDGLCGGVTAIIAIGFLILSVVIAQQNANLGDFAAYAERVNMDGLRVVIALALLGGVLGFVPYNFNPASIFMGDTGSMFLGYACALMMILVGSVDGKWLLAASVMFALPVLDTSLAFARRYVAGRPFFSADRHHFHHQLVQRGLTVKQAVLVSYLLTLFFVMCGILIVFMRSRYAVGFYMVLFGSVIVAAFKMGMVHERTSVAKAATLEKSKSHATGEELNTEGVLEIRTDKPVVELK
jgi:UDP-GlcNAc:undecaprenyl-phosphate/decaprenyl-phosphate GlcNAc-1-phosphate transferase